MTEDDLKLISSKNNLETDNLNNLNYCSPSLQKSIKSINKFKFKKVDQRHKSPRNSAKKTINYNELMSLKPNSEGFIKNDKEKVNDNKENNIDDIKDNLNLKFPFTTKNFSKKVNKIDYSLVKNLLNKYSPTTSTNLENLDNLDNLDNLGDNIPDNIPDNIGDNNRDDIGDNLNRYTNSNINIGDNTYNIDNIQDDSPLIKPTYEPKKIFFIKSRSEGSKKNTYIKGDSDNKYDKNDNNQYKDHNIDNNNLDYNLDNNDTNNKTKLKNLIYSKEDPNYNPNYYPDYNPDYNIDNNEAEVDINNFELFKQKEFRVDRESNYYSKRPKLFDDKIEFNNLELNDNFYNSCDFDTYSFLNDINQLEQEIDMNINLYEINENKKAIKLPNSKIHKVKKNKESTITMRVKMKKYISDDIVGNSNANNDYYLKCMLKNRINFNERKTIKKSEINEVYFDSLDNLLENKEKNMNKERDKDKDKDIFKKFEKKDSKAVKGNNLNLRSIGVFKNNLFEAARKELFKSNNSLRYYSNILPSLN